MLKNRTLIRQYGARNRKLKSAGFENYDLFLRSDLWKSIKDLWRSKMVDSPDVWGKCSICGARENLVFHHQKYGKVARLSLNGMVVLCGGCHKKVHDFANEKQNFSLRRATRAIRKMYNK